MKKSSRPTKILGECSARVGEILRDGPYRSGQGVPGTCHVNTPICSGRFRANTCFTRAAVPPHGSRKSNPLGAPVSALRLSRIFAAEHLESYPFYIEVDPEGDFDIEYLGGQWHEELIDGVQFFFPASDGNKLDVVEVWGQRVCDVRCRARPAGSEFANSESATRPLRLLRVIRRCGQASP